VNPSRTLLAFAGGAVGTFDASPGDPLWDVDVRQWGYHVLAFPEAPVWITFPGREPVLADRTRVMLHRHGQVYRRSLVRSYGDHCRFLAIEDGLAREVLAGVDPGAAEREPFEFPSPYASVDAATYLAFRRAMRAALAWQDEDSASEVAFSAVTAAVRASARDACRPRESGRGAAARRDLVEAAKEAIAVAVAAGEHIGLGVVARRVHSSPYHLSRVFKRVTGVAMHRHLTEVRLRAGLDALLGADPDEPIAPLAHRLGFASHQHFSTSFRALFGATPSEVRGGPGRRQARKILEARASGRT